MSEADKLEITPETQVTNDNTTPVDEGKVDPWTVGKNVDYDRLVQEFGTQLITPELLQRIERIIGEPVHPWLRRGIFFSNRDLSHILDLYESGTPFYLYTGRGPSSNALHFGHMVPFMFTQWLQRVFNVPLVIQLTDDEKFYFKGYLTLEESSRLGFENAKDIIACGFDIQKTFIFRDTDYIQHLYPTVVRINRTLTLNKIQSLFGFDNSSNIGKFAFPSIQAAPSFSACFPHIFGDRTDVPCLIPCAIDQDLYFRMTREIAPTLKYQKPAVIHSSFFPALEGPGGKMSASDFNSCIYMTDTPQQIAEKVYTHAFSGGRATLEEHRELGGDCDKDVSFQYMRFFLFDDDELENVRLEYSSGRMTAYEIKTKLVQILTKFVSEFNKKRNLVTDDMVRAFMTIRDIEP